LTLKIDTEIDWQEMFDERVNPVVFASGFLAGAWAADVNASYRLGQFTSDEIQYTRKNCPIEEQRRH
jgi:hypothetical protein